MDDDPPQPRDEFGGRLAAELVEVAMGFKKRVLNDVGGAHPAPQPGIELRGHHELQIIRIEGEEPPQAAARTFAGGRK